MCIQNAWLNKIPLINSVQICWFSPANRLEGFLSVQSQHLLIDVEGEGGTNCLSLISGSWVTPTEDKRAWFDFSDLNHGAEGLCKLNQTPSVIAIWRFCA